jgi:phosphoglycerol transferase MdoB-like AlkP superfamily enzyme
VKFRIHSLVRLAFFWLVFFAFFRILFILYHHDKFPDRNFLSNLYALIAGYRLDLSMISYFLMVPFLLWSLQQFLRHRIIHKLNHVYNTAIILAVTFLSVSNILIYNEWGTLLNYRALSYILYPKEMLASLPMLSVIIIIITCLIIFAGATLFYKRLLVNFSYMYEGPLKKIGLMVSFIVVLILGARGGIQQIPINESVACYSKHTINNNLATNNIWYLLHNCLDVRDEKNPYYFMEKVVAEKRLKKLFTENSSPSKKMLIAGRSNVVFIILESWTADIIEMLGGEKNVTPNFNKLAKQGVLFTNAYASGYRTDQGVVSILSGFPAQPNTSIMTNPGKSMKLPSVTKLLAKDGYQTSFYYGGEIEFANMKTYLVNSGFEKIIDKKDFDPKYMNSKWGAHDEYVFEKQLNDLKDQEQPFLSVLLTLSTHEPFEVPMKDLPYKGDADPEKFSNAAYYTDHCLGKYFEAASRESWFSKTLFVLVADHGHHFPLGRDMNMPEAKKITMLLYGDVLEEEYKGFKMNKIVSQNDIPAILLDQFNKDYSMFPWSKKLDDAEFAYFANENVLGWITPQEKLVYSFTSSKVIYENDSLNVAVRDSLLIDSKAFLQGLYQQYLNY